MARTTLDLSPRVARSDDQQKRPATFRRANLPDGASSDGVDDSSSRRAAYRPREDVAVRRDIVREFRNQLERDATGCSATPAVAAAALFGVARAEEALGRFEAAQQAVQRFDHVATFSPMVWALASRLHRQLGRAELAVDTLDRAADAADGARANLLRLQRISHDWLDGASVEKSLSAVDQLGEAGGDYTRLWKTRLIIDALAERGNVGGVVDHIHSAVESLERPDLRDNLRTRAGVWSAVWGDVDTAVALLEQINRRNGLAGDLGELLGALYFETDDRSSARQLFADRDALGAAESVTAAMLEDTVGNDPSAADRRLDDLASRQPDDWTALRVRETHLEGQIDRSGAIDKPGESLIDVLNLQLEGPLSSHERVTKLTRLGRLYEGEAGLEEAAAEVYREALTIAPDHVPALRALGRLYSRRGNWAGLADLYEREIAQMSGAPSVWRRHFQLAEIYRVRLSNSARALEHYLKVLDHRQHYLPALKAAAGLLGELGRWGELADLFLKTVDVAPNRRQKLYLLDKVAEVAERQLDNLSVAIGAWQEILLLDGRHPRAFAALGRLYAKTDRWEELIELNLREIDLLDDPEEEAVLRQKCADIADRHLDDPQRAEQYYRQALAVLPDFLPALEGLGRIYMQNERWDDIVEMSGRELQQTDDRREAVRRLGALAEIFEARLDCRRDAIRLYERILDIDPTNAHAIESAIRLNYTLARWPSVVALIERKIAETTDPRAYAELQGELGLIAEWRQAAPDRAYSRYLAALDAQPGNPHWLAGVARTWAAADPTAARVADRLEDNVMEPMPGEVRDQYFKVIGRLRERTHADADSSRAYRMHGSSDSLENQLVLQLAMAESGERDMLRQFRRTNPSHAIERLIDIDPAELTVGDVDAIREAIASLTDDERQTLVSHLPVDIGAQFCRPDDQPDLRLSAELVRVLDGDSLQGDDEQATPHALSMRLRGMEARQADDFDGYVQWTRREIDCRDHPVLRVMRLTELAQYAAQDDRDEKVTEFLREAAHCAFPQIEAGAGQQAGRTDAATVEDHPMVDRLYEAMRATEHWQLLCDCLRVHATMDGLTRRRRLNAYRTLAEVLEDQLADLEGASTALSHCWQLSEDPDYLRQLVRVSMGRDELDRAIRFQQRHFEHLSADGSGADRLARVHSGLWLAELLLQEDDRLEDGIDCLEHLLATFDEVELVDEVRRRLAYAYFDKGNAFRAVELFQDVLGEEVGDDEIADWRKLVDLYRLQLDDHQTAYKLQWTIVASEYAQGGDLEDAIDLGFETGALEDCVDRLQALADDADRSRRRRLIARAAQIVDEDLVRPEEAVGMYTEALDLCQADGRGGCCETDHGLELVRRRAFCLAQIAGEEHRAVQEFRTLISAEPFESTTYRGLADLLERSQAFDRARIAKQILRVLDCAVDIDKPRAKTEPSRALDAWAIESYVLPDELCGGVLEVLQAAMPLAEKVWSDELPQRKALEGVRLDKLDVQPAYDSLEGALEAFDIGRFKADSGDSGPTTPQVFATSTPYMWFNYERLDAMDDAELRFNTGYAAALAWCGLSALLTLDGRRVWRLIEAVHLRQNDRGFDARVDMDTQRLVDRVSSPFDAVARRRLMGALEPVADTFAQVHCEGWPRAVEQFACRVGLVMSGDICAAVRGLLGFHGWELPLDAPETQVQIRRNEDVRALLAYATSDEYLQARHAVGLAAKPTELVR